MLHRAAAAFCVTMMCAPSWALAGNSTCIVDRDIVQTTRPDDTHIIFTLRDHHVWQNTLPVRCFGLHDEPDGFTFQPTDPGTGDLCSGQVTIRLNFSRTICQLGDFNRIK